MCFQWNRTDAFAADIILSVLSHFSLQGSLCEIELLPQYFDEMVGKTPDWKLEELLAEYLDYTEQLDLTYGFFLHSSVPTVLGHL